MLQESVVATFVFTGHDPFVRLAQPRECLDEGRILRRSRKICRFVPRLLRFSGKVKGDLGGGGDNMSGVIILLTIESSHRPHFSSVESAMLSEAGRDEGRRRPTV